MNKKIVSCEINKVGYVNEVYVEFEDGSGRMIFNYYPDELTFEASEFIGLTKEEAMELYVRRDTDYLRS